MGQIIIIQEELPLETRPKNKKKWPFILILFVIALLAFGAFRIIGVLQPPKVEIVIPVNVSVTTAELGTIEAYTPLTGRIDPVESATILPMASGEVTAVYASLGDYVNKGDRLFDIDSSQVSTSYQQAKISYNAASEEFDRIALLYKEGAVSQQQYENVKTQVDIARQNLASASNALGNYRISSPINGFVTSLTVSVGSVAAQGNPAFTISDTSQLEINTGVSEYLINSISIGDSVSVFLRTLSDEPFSGTIEAFSPAPATGSLTYPITLSIDNSDGMIKAGMFAEIQIVSDRRENVLCIPSESVFMKSGESKVAVLSGRIPTLVTVTTGLDNGTLVEITSGLSTGDLIVTAGQQYVVEGEEVNIVTE